MVTADLLSRARAGRDGEAFRQLPAPGPGRRATALVALATADVPVPAPAPPVLEILRPAANRSDTGTDSAKLA
jgi:hypothetical protein